MAEAKHTYGIAEFDAALQQLGWKVADFCRQAGLHRNTPSRWRTDAVPIPLWVEKFLGMALEVKRLHDRFILLPKGEGTTEEPDT